MLGYDVWNEINYSPDVDYYALHQGRLPRLAEGEVRQPRRPRRGLVPLRPTPSGTTSSRRSQVGPYPEVPRLARLQARQLLRPDAVAHRHHPRGRPGLPDRRARRRRRHPRHGGQRLRRLARRLQGRGLSATPGSRRARAASPGATSSAPTSPAPPRAASRSGTPSARAARSGCSRRCSAATRKTAASWSPRTSASGRMTSFAAGARGMLNLRYRPLLDGPLFGAFGSYGMDGSRTPRSDMASRIAKWANAPEQKPLMAAQAGQGRHRPPRHPRGAGLRLPAQPRGQVRHLRRGDVGRLSRLLRQRHPGRLGAHRRHRRLRHPLRPLPDHADRRERRERSPPGSRPAAR